jgi:hypothetical protein
LGLVSRPCIRTIEEKGGHAHATQTIPTELD